MKCLNCKQEINGFWSQVAYIAKGLFDTQNMINKTNNTYKNPKSFLDPPSLQELNSKHYYKKNKLCQSCGQLLK